MDSILMVETGYLNELASNVSTNLHLTDAD